MRELRDKENGYTIDKADAINVLERTIDFVRNCDNKASIFLGVFGVILTIILTTDGVSNFITIINSIQTNITLYGIAYLLFMIVSVFCTVYGVFRIMKVLGVQIDKKKYVKEKELDLDSKIFFDHISKNANYLIYKEKLLKMSDEDFINDIISQIYINSVICSDKYKNYKCGFKYSLIGFCAFIFLWIVGIFIF